MEKSQEWKEAADKKIWIPSEIITRIGRNWLHFQGERSKTLSIGTGSLKYKKGRGVLKGSQSWKQLEPLIWDIWGWNKKRVYTGRTRNRIRKLSSHVILLKIGINKQILIKIPGRFKWEHKNLLVLWRHSRIELSDIKRKLKRVIKERGKGWGNRRF